MIQTRSPQYLNSRLFQYKLSIIIPIEVVKPNHYRVNRLASLLEGLKGNIWCEIVVVDSSSCTKSNNCIRNLCAKYSAKYRKIPYSKQFSIGVSRDSGSKISSGKYLLFLDSDLSFSRCFLSALYEKILDLDRYNNPARFVIIPCFYLSQIGTKSWGKASPDYANYIRLSFLKGSSRLVESLAVVSSAIIVNRVHYLRIGGHNPVFRGHGCEDFELLHRLSSKHPHSVKPVDYYKDFKTRLVGEYRGFRAYFAVYGMENLFSDLYLLHLWHPRIVDRKRLKQRTVNEDSLQRVMRDYDNDGKDLKPLKSTIQMDRNNAGWAFISWLDGSSFLDQKRCFIKSPTKHYYSLISDFKANSDLTNGLPVEGIFGGLTGVREGNYLSYQMYRKLRKLIVNPHLFLSDSYLFKLVLRYFKWVT